jgi:hypothetical protein
MALSAYVVKSCFCRAYGNLYYLIFIRLEDVTAFCSYADYVLLGMIAVPKLFLVSKSCIPIMAYRTVYDISHICEMLLTYLLRGLSPQANYTDRATAKLVLTFADRECHVVSVTDPYGRILGFLDRTCCKSYR